MHCDTIAMLAQLSQHFIYTLSPSIMHTNLSQKTYVASKADGGPGTTVVWKSFDERVDENGEPVQQTSPLRYVPLSFPLVYTLG